MPRGGAHHFPIGRFRSRRINSRDSRGKASRKSEREYEEAKNAKEEATRRDDDEDDGGFDVG